MRTRAGLFGMRKSLKHFDVDGKSALANELE
jgi:hypothetical protein